MLPRDFTDVDIDSALRHEADSTLWIRRLIHVEIVNIGSIVSYLKVPDHAVSLQDKRH